MVNCISVLLLFSGWVVSNSLWPHELQHSRLPCPSLSPGVSSDSYPLSWWCYLTISSSAVLFSLPSIFPSIWVFSNELALHIKWLLVIVQLLSCFWPFATLWTTASQAPLSSTIARSLLRCTSIESVMLSNHLILCHPLLLWPSIFPSIRVFSTESASLYQVAKTLELQHQSFQWIFRVDFL